MKVIMIFLMKYANLLLTVLLTRTEVLLIAKFPNFLISYHIILIIKDMAIYSLNKKFVNIAEWGPLFQNKTLQPWIYGQTAYDFCAKNILGLKCPYIAALLNLTQIAAGVLQSQAQIAVRCPGIAL